MKVRYSLTPLLAFLLIGLFACQQQTDTAVEAAPVTNDSTANPGLQIVYVYSDSVLANYKDFSEKLGQLEDQSVQAERTYERGVANLQRDVQKVQERMQQGLIAPNQIASEQEKIAQREQQILQQRDRSIRELQQAQLELNEELQSNVKRVLKDLQDEYGYDYILSYGPGTGVLMVNEAFDITEIVLERLNQSAPPEASTPDSTASDK